MAQDNGARPGQLPDVVQPPQIPANLPGQIEALMGEMRRQREREENRDRGRPHPGQVEADPLLGADQHGVPPGPPNPNNRRRIEEPHANAHYARGWLSGMVLGCFLLMAVIGFMIFYPVLKKGLSDPPAVPPASGVPDDTDDTDTSLTDIQEEQRLGQALSAGLGIGAVIDQMPPRLKLKMLQFLLTHVDLEPVSPVLADAARSEPNVTVTPATETRPRSRPRRDDRDVLHSIYMETLSRHPEREDPDTVTTESTPQSPDHPLTNLAPPTPPPSRMRHPTGLEEDGADKEDPLRIRTKTQYQPLPDPRAPKGSGSEAARVLGALTAVLLILGVAGLGIHCLKKRGFIC